MVRNVVALPMAGSNALRSRAYNRSLVLGHVRGSGTSGRAEIARTSGLSTQAVSNIIADLVSEGWLVEAGTKTRGRGLPAMQYALDAQAGIAIGIEVRPQALLMALTDLDGQVLFSRRVRVTDASPNAIAQKVKEIQQDALDSTQVDADRLIGAGIVMPGPFGATGLSGAASDLPGWSQVDASALFSGALNLPVIIENDASASAMAEMVSGLGQNISSFAYLYFGTGFGLGVISNRDILRGANGNAGEIGHIPMLCRGATVSLEQIVSRMELKRRLAEIGEDADTTAALEDLHKRRSPVLEGWMEDAAAALSTALLIVENLYDPETVIAGGALPKALLEDLLSRVTLAERSVANRPARAHPRLICGICGPLTATYGAAALVINQTFTPRMVAQS